MQHNAHDPNFPYFKDKGTQGQFTEGCIGGPADSRSGTVGVNAPTGVLPLLMLQILLENPS